MERLRKKMSNFGDKVCLRMISQMKTSILRRSQSQPDKIHSILTLRTQPMIMIAILAVKKKARRVVNQGRRYKNIIKKTAMKRMITIMRLIKDLLYRKERRIRRKRLHLEIIRSLEMQRGNARKKSGRRNKTRNKGIKAVTRMKTRIRNQKRTKTWRIKRRRTKNNCLEMTSRMK